MIRMSELGGIYRKIYDIAGGGIDIAERAHGMAAQAILIGLNILGSKTDATYREKY